MLRHFLVLVLLVGVTMALPSSVFAHAAYERSTPARGEVLATAPSTVEIFTTQDVRRQAGSNLLTVEDEQGSRVSEGDVRVDDANRRRISVALKSGLPAGRYVVRFQTLSDEDGETDRGAFAFYVGNQPTAAQRAQDAQLRVTEGGVDAPHAEGSSAAPIVGGIIAVVFVALLAVTGWLVFRKRGGAAV